MPSARTTLKVAAIAANTFSGVTALVRFRPILPGMRQARVPESWLPMIGTLKTAGGLSLATGFLALNSTVLAQETAARRSAPAHARWRR